MAAYYNELDPYAAQWLRNLIAAAHIAPGDVDERSIVDVRPDDLRGYDQCHFFAGIGGWSLALRLAGWPDDRPVWTGSCPCQPFSSAGRGAAADDERHLWPAWLPLIAECRPAIVFGEQVEAAIGWGWLDAVFADLESEGYACGASVLPACGVGAPHIRQRVWFVADTQGARWRMVEPAHERSPDGKSNTPSNSSSGSLLVAHAVRSRASPGAEPSTAHQDARRARRRRDAESRHGGELLGMADTDAPGFGLKRRGGLLDGQRAAQRDDADGRGADGGMADTGHEHPRRPAGTGEATRGRALRDVAGRSPWRDLVWLPCTDGKARPTKPGLQPLAHGVSARVGKLRAAGNAIVPQVAAAFIKASAGERLI